MKLCIAEILATHGVTFRFRTIIWIAFVFSISSLSIYQASAITPESSRHYARRGHRTIPAAAQTTATRKKTKSRSTPVAPSSFAGRSVPRPITPQAYPLGTSLHDPAASPRPAQIALKGGLLTVAANDSDLGQILKEIANRSGMAVNGSIRSIRVFGIYGPAASSIVLTELLTGLGYNFIMTGATQSGPPRELHLTPRKDGGAQMPAPMPDTIAPNRPDPSPDQEPLGPGAVTTVPPESQNQQDRVQQNLQRLEQMRAPQKPPQ